MVRAPARLRADPSSRTRLRPFGTWPEGRSIFVLEEAERAGHALHTIFVDDLDSLVSEIASRDISPAERETYSNGVRKAIYRDADGNEIGFGDAPG
jgi:hypothetical protein